MHPEDSGQAIEAELRNISVGGVFISCENPPDPDETVQTVIQAPNGKTLSVTVEVVWSNINGSDDVKVPPGTGARFVKISGADRQYLTEVISHLRWYSHGASRKASIRGLSLLCSNLMQ